MHRALLLQVFLHKLLKAHQELLQGKVPSLLFAEEGRESLYTLALKMDQKRIQALLLKTPLLKEKQLLTILQKICRFLEPLIERYKEEENVFLFLLKHQEGIDQLMHVGYLYNLLVKIHPEGLEVVGENHCDRYHRRGFFTQISECKRLLTQLIYAHSTPLSRL
jgi:hypothetical protein